MAHDRVLLDVAGAVVSSEGVDWDRARRATPPDQRRVLDNLRALSRVFAGVGHGGLDRFRATAGDPVGTAFVRLAFGALLAVAALHAAGSLVTIAWSWHRAIGAPFALPRMLVLVSFLVCAAVLLIGGRLDRRAQLMGAVFLVRRVVVLVPVHRNQVGPSRSLPARAAVGVRAGIPAGGSTHPAR